MKIYIYIILLILLVVYIKCHSNYVGEKFNEPINENFDAPNPYKILNTEKVKPILIDNNSNMINGFDTNDSSNLYKSKYWVIKDKGFSDIYNYEDLGGLQIFNSVNKIDNMYKLVESEIKKNDKPKVKSDIKTEKDKFKLDKIKNVKIPIELKYNNNSYNYIGTASNEYYNQYYYLYEYETKTKISKVELKEELIYLSNNKVFEYLLVKSHKNKQIVSHYIGPRSKININDVVYFALGTFQLGPLVIKK